MTAPRPSGATGFLLDLVAANRRGERVGLPSVCSAHPAVLEAAMRHAATSGTVACIESTCNQVNQFGGYTGLTPAGFRDAVLAEAAAADLPPDRLILGGDHLGPWPWRDEPAEAALGKAADLVRDHVAAGYAKIHLDASMRCADDPGEEDVPLADEVVAARSAWLCRAAEEAHAALPKASPAPVYVIGSEVPLPGGEQCDTHGPIVTEPAAVARTLAVACEAFARAGLEAAWERVVAVVVQPGVEFGDDIVYDYDQRATLELTALIESRPGMVFEAHSTDYQTVAALRQLVAGHFAVLKVGPQLTFALREALFALESIERELLAGRDDEARSRLRETLDQEMLADPGAWRPYYHGDSRRLRLSRAFSYSDRCRYYWARAPVRAALETLLRNLAGRPLPATLLSQYLPAEYSAVRSGELAAQPAALVRHHIGLVLAAYGAACGDT